MRGPFEESEAVPEEFFQSGDLVVAVVRGRMRPKGSSAAIENRTGFLWTFRDGEVESVRLFAKPQEALKAAGLRE
jgi:ketosteroid isomerase-like protein